MDNPEHIKSYKGIFNLKLIIQLSIIACFLQSLHAQTNSDYRIIRSTVGSAGSINNIKTALGTFNVSQSIGQSGVIGTGSNNNYYMLQGYQQPIFALNEPISRNKNLNATIFPNPFNSSLYIRFTSIINDDVHVKLYDVHGKIMYSKIFSETQTIDLQIGDLSKGIYLLNIQSNGTDLNEKVIKF